MSETLRLYPDRAKWVLAALACAIMTAGGVWIIADGQWFGLVPTAFFGVGLVVSLILLWPTSSFLELNTHGFVIRNLFRNSRLLWAHIQSFEARRIGIRKMVTFTFVPEYAALPRARAVLRALSLAEGALPDTYGKSAEDLARLMNERLRIHRQSMDKSGT